MAIDGGNSDPDIIKKLSTLIIKKKGKVKMLEAEVFCEYNITTGHSIDLFHSNFDVFCSKVITGLQWYISLGVIPFS